MRKPSGDGTVFADIPGLIAGAHQGTGLGHEFLRHIERTRLMLHLIDVTSPDPIADYHTIQQELQAYGRGLAERPQILALNKIDAVDLGQKIEVIAAQLETLSNAPVFLISAVAHTGLEPMLQQIWSNLDVIAKTAA